METKHFILGPRKEVEPFSFYGICRTEDTTEIKLPKGVIVSLIT